MGSFSSPRAAGAVAAPYPSMFSSLRVFAEVRTWRLCGTAGSAGSDFGGTNATGLGAAVAFGRCRAFA